MSHALLLDIGVGSALWSVSRGLARNASDYKRLLMTADQPRRNDLDGRGALSQEALNDFCEFFLETCLDQIRYMRELLDPSELQRRMELYVRDEESAERLPKRSFTVLREALLSGELERGRVPGLIDASERTARRVISALIEKRLLISGSHRAPLRLAFPIDVVERWFPRLYPAT
jgi:Fic family protein